MNMELRWVWRVTATTRGPHGDTTWSTCVLQYRTTKGESYLEDGYMVQDWNRWTDVPVEVGL